MPFLRAEGKHYIYDGLNGVPLRSVISKILAKISVIEVKFCINAEISFDKISLH